MQWWWWEPVLAVGVVVVDGRTFVGVAAVCRSVVAAAAVAVISGYFFI